MLDYIPSAEEIRKMGRKELKDLSASIRSFLVEKVSEKGGHLSSNLGTVELTLALFSVFDFPKDRVIFDVGHQSYTYKLLTGRKDGFEHLRDLDGMSGFPKRRESEYDAFDTGHSSTSISAGLGMVEGRDLLKKDYKVISVIGDGSMTGGEAYEALNNAAALKSNFIIILNDNGMSISQNVGGLRKYLTGIRAGSKYNRAKTGVKSGLSRIPLIGSGIVGLISRIKDSIKEIFVPGGMLFENLGITYLGPVDGHNIPEMQRVFQKAAGLDRAVLIHVRTVKGKGYGPAEENPGAFHGVNPFDIATGRPKVQAACTSWSEAFGEWIEKRAHEDEKICAVTAAMGDNVGLNAFEKSFPDRFFDVGIAEQHAVTFSAGLALSGMKPVCAVFSSFLQRGYDQILEDVCMQDAHVLFAVDRAGIVGRDGETHQGLFDIAYLSSMPNLCLMAPKNRQELERMLEFSNRYPHPSAVRYPRGAAFLGLSGFDAPVEYGKAEVLRKGSKIAILGFGDMVRTGDEVCRILLNDGIHATLVNLRFAAPFDRELLKSLLPEHTLFVTMEDGVLTGGIGEQIASFLYQEAKEQISVLTVGVPDMFVPQGNTDELKKMLRMDAESIAERIRQESRS